GDVGLAYVDVHTGVADRSVAPTRRAAHLVHRQTDREVRRRCVRGDGPTPHDGAVARAGARGAGDAAERVLGTIDVFREGSIAPAAAVPGRARAAGRVLGIDGLGSDLDGPDGLERLPVGGTF